MYKLLFAGPVFELKKSCEELSRDTTLTIIFLVIAMFAIVGVLLFLIIKAKNSNLRKVVKVLAILAASAAIVGVSAFGLMVLAIAANIGYC